MSAELIEADVFDFLRGNQWLAQNGHMPKAHAVIADPPYFLGSIGKRFGGKNAAPAQFGKDGAFSRLSGRQRFKKCASHFFIDPGVVQANDGDSALSKDFIPFSITVSLPVVNFLNVKLDNQVTFGEVEVSNKGGVVSLENMLVNEGDTQIQEALGGIYLSLRVLESRPRCVGKCACFTKRGHSTFRIGVRLVNDALADTQTASDVVASGGTELTAVLTLDMRRRTGELRAADSTDKIDVHARLLCAQDIRAGATTSGLTPPLEAGSIGLVGNAADRTFTVKFLAHDGLLDVLENPIISQTGFMGKTWDGFYDVWQYQAWVTAWAELLLDFVYPGAILAMFGGTRTYHRLAAGLEDAGWEVFDCMMYLYGSGFPKAADIGKLIDRSEGTEREIVGYGDGGLQDNYKLGDDGWYGANCRERMSPIGKPSHPDAQRFDGYKTALKPAYEIIVLARAPFSLSTERGIILANLKKLGARLCLLFNALPVESIFTLLPTEQSAVSNIAQWSADAITSTRDALFGQMDTSQSASVMSLSWNIVSSWLNTWGALCNNGNTSTIETALNTTIEWKTLNSCLSQITPESIVQNAISRLGLKSIASPVESYFSAVEKSMNAIQMLFAAANATSSVRANLEASSASRFSTEATPIVLARAPRGSTTYAELAQMWGTGALNVDAGRIEASGDYKDFGVRYGASSMQQMGGFQTRPYVQERIANRKPINTSEASKFGRYPSNLILDEAAAALLDAQSGDCKAGGNLSGQEPSARLSGIFDSNLRRDRHEWSSYADSGGASRFFYTAKAARWEREAGLEDFDPQAVGDGRQKPIDNAYQRGETQRRNTHPTVKPIQLIEYIARLLLPPMLDAPRRVLVPFAGSGSEMIGCQLAGWEDVVGIEREAEYCAINRQRVAWWSQFDNYGVAKATQKQDALAVEVDDSLDQQLDLFADAQEFQP